MARYLSLSAIKLIEKAVDLLFDRAKIRYLGPDAEERLGDKRIYAGFSPTYSLPGIIHSAAREERSVPDQKVIRALIQNASHYLDSYRSAAKAQVIKQVQGFLQEAELAGVQTDVQTVLGGKLTDVWGKVTNDVKRMVDTELNNGRNMGALEGIISVNTAQGIEDPVVYWVVVRDQHLCGECKKLHLLEDGATPRCWYLSEVAHGYHKKGEEHPNIGGLHPHCRCTMVTLMPGYGFSSEGAVRFIGNSHDEVEAQRGGLKKSEYLAKSTPGGISVLKALQEKYRQNASSVRPPSGRNAIEASQQFIGALQRAPITMNFPYSKLEDISAAGRLKNLYETGEGMGATDTQLRSAWENTALHIPEHTIPQHRPLYGALHFMHGTPVGQRGGAYQYGDSWFELKPHVKERATFTPEDTSCESGDRTVLHGDIHKIADHYATIVGEERANWIHHVLAHGELHPDAADRRWRGPGAYVEAQVHGGVNLGKDVEAIHLGPNLLRFGEEPEHELDAGRQQGWIDKAMAVAKKHGVKLVGHFAVDGDTSPPVSKVLYDPTPKFEQQPPLTPGEKPQQTSLPLGVPRVGVSRAAKGKAGTAAPRRKRSPKAAAP